MEFYNLLLISFDKFLSWYLFVYYEQHVLTEPSSYISDWSSGRGPISFHLTALKLANEIDVLFCFVWSGERGKGGVGLGGGGGGKTGVSQFLCPKITSFKLTLRMWKAMTIEHKWILCKKLETEMERYMTWHRESEKLVYDLLIMACHMRGPQLAEKLKAK